MPDDKVHFPKEGGVLCEAVQNQFLNKYIEGVIPD
jgi:hypothetical protein